VHDDVLGQWCPEHVDGGAIEQHAAAEGGGAERVGEQFGGAGHREVLASDQVAAEGSDCRAVARRRPGRRREGCFGRRPALAAARGGPVLGHLEAASGQVEHLAALHLTQLGTGEASATPLTPPGPMIDDGVGVVDELQSRAGLARLLAGTALGLVVALQQLLRLGSRPAAPLRPGSAARRLAVGAGSRCPTTAACPSSPSDGPAPAPTPPPERREARCQPAAARSELPAATIASSSVIRFCSAVTPRSKTERRATSSTTISVPRYAA
jgi:hypothetical protein